MQQLKGVQGGLSKASDPYDREFLRRNVPYPLLDRVSFAERKVFGITELGKRKIGDVSVLGEWGGGRRDGKFLAAVWDGKPRRKPKAGEWYLSGAQIGAYRAPNDLSTAFHIAKLQLFERTTSVKVKPI